ncbi:hypothetical protein KFE25_002982 [Diacronema lutheri]|uniref:Uncharacterized protein n=1 Tax=Diacronema lutheri TaxID=2081491 RepID=A0A8J5XPM2_DIALT|nr:hypothetical protein KFE25_002982 [Diacronema lutheri]
MPSAKNSTQGKGSKAQKADAPSVEPVADANASITKTDAPDAALADASAPSSANAAKKNNGSPDVDAPAEANKAESGGVDVGDGGEDSPLALTQMPVEPKPEHADAAAAVDGGADEVTPEHKTKKPRTSKDGAKGKDKEAPKAASASTTARKTRANKNLSEPLAALE